MEMGWANYQSVSVKRFHNDVIVDQDDYVAEEVPVVLVYNGLSHVVMLATPTNLEDFVLGFSISEGIIQSADELENVKTYQRANGIEMRLTIPQERFINLSDKARNLTGRTGCGLCGSTTLKNAIKPPRLVKGDGFISSFELIQAITNLQMHQNINQLTGALHAVAWVCGQEIIAVREDVGRHNALDKLIGALLKRKTDVSKGFILTTSRASYEMIQKTTAIGVSIFAAISAPTALAIRLAHRSGLTLIGFARNASCVIYSHPQRFIL